MKVSRTLLTLLSLIAMIAILAGCPEKVEKPDKPNDGNGNVIGDPVKPEPKKTTISGFVHAPVEGASLAGIEVAAYVGDKQVGAGAINPDDGAFKLELTQAGQVDLRFKLPSFDFPYSPPGYTVKQGENAEVGKIDLPADAFPSEKPVPVPVDPVDPAPTPPTTTSHTDEQPDHKSGGITLSGQVEPPDAMVWLMKEGVEVARTKAVDGKFTFPELKHGLYRVEFAAPGFAPQTFEAVPMHSDTALSTMLFMTSEIEGVDWEEGYITVIGKGEPNPNAPSPASARIGAQRAAKADAYRSLLAKIMTLKTGKDTTVADFAQETSVPGRIEGIVQGAVFGEPTTSDDGSVTIEVKIKIQDVAKTIMNITR